MIPASALRTGAGYFLDCVVAREVYGLDPAVDTFPAYSTDIDAASLLAFGNAPRLYRRLGVITDPIHPEDEDDLPDRWFCGPLPLPSFDDPEALRAWHAAAESHRTSMPLAIVRGALAYLRRLDASTIPTGVPHA